MALKTSKGSSYFLARLIDAHYCRQTELVFVRSHITHFYDCSQLCMIGLCLLIVSFPVAFFSLKVQYVVAADL